VASEKTISGMLSWLGIDAPTEQQTVLIGIAADDAEYTIKDIRQQDDSEDIEPKYQGLAIEMGVYLYEKRGVDGVTSFTENGISRVYERGTFPNSMLRRITPKPSIAAFVKPPVS
jgi:hypothetical protein